MTRPGESQTANNTAMDVSSFLLSDSNIHRFEVRTFLFCFLLKKKICFANVLMSVPVGGASVCVCVW